MARSVREYVATAMALIYQEILVCQASDIDHFARYGHSALEVIEARQQPCASFVNDASPKLETCPEHELSVRKGIHLQSRCYESPLGSRLGADQSALGCHLE